MVDPWSRRDVFGQLLAAGITVHLPAGDGPGRGISSEGAMVSGNIGTLRLFTSASRVSLPSDCELIWTTGHSQPGNGPACYRRDASVDQSYVRANPRTAFIDGKGQGFRLLEQDVDVRQTGAIGDGAVDDTAAIQEALDFVEAAGGGMVIIPTGEYKVTAPLRLLPRVAMRGAGPASVLRVTGSDGIVINASDEIGPRSISDFAIQGRGCENFTAIVVDVEDPRRVQGLVFERLYLSFFGTGIRSRGLWHSTFRTITMNQIWGGGIFTGRNVKVLIDDCRLTHGGLLRGTGDAVGIVIGDDKHVSRPEDMQIKNSIIYGFAKAIIWRTGLFGGIQNCDLDACTKTGLELVTADGGFTFANNWININSESGYGIDCTTLGYDPKTTNILLGNNNINSTAKSLASSAIRLGDRQSDIVIDGNGISGSWTNGIIASGARRICLLNNKTDSSIIIERCTDIMIAQNFSGGGIRLTNNVGLNVGTGYGQQSPTIIGTISIPAGKTTQTATFRSLGLANLPDGNYHTTLALDTGSLKIGESIRGKVTQTNITITADYTSPNETQIPFQIKVY